jgi:hypothetical protein
MQHSRVLRATVCAACLLMGGAAFAQGANYSIPNAKFTRLALNGAAIGGAGGLGAGGIHGNFSTGGVRGNFSSGSVHNNFAAGGLHGWHGARHHWAHGYGGGGPDYAYGWGYPYYDYGWDYPDYAYDYGYPYDTYAEGAYCQTPENSCPLDHPAVAGEACQCRSGVDEVPGTTEP